MPDFGHLAYFSRSQGLLGVFGGLGVGWNSWNIEDVSSQSAANHA